MLELTVEARDLLRAYFEGKELSPLRVYLAGGCAGSHLTLILDSQAETDEAFQIDEFTFLVDKVLFEEAKPISIDASPMGGFQINSSLELDSSGGCGACNSCA